MRKDRIPGPMVGGSACSTRGPSSDGRSQGSENNFLKRFQKLSGGGGCEGSDIVTGVVKVAAVGGFNPWPRNYCMPQVWPKIK